MHNGDLKKSLKGTLGVTGLFWKGTCLKQEDKVKKKISNEHITTKLLKTIFLLCVFGFLTYLLSIVGISIPIATAIFTAILGIITLTVYEEIRTRKGIKATFRIIQKETKNRRSTEYTFLVESYETISKAVKNKRRSRRRSFMSNNSTKWLLLFHFPLGKCVKILGRIWENFGKLFILHYLPN